MERHRRLSAFLLGVLLAPILGLMSDVQGQAADRAASIKARNGLEVCIWPAYYGISFRNPRDDALRGIDIDLARAFAKDLAVPVRFIDSSFASFMPDLEEDRCDVAMFAIGDTPQRRARVDQFVGDIKRDGRLEAAAKEHGMTPIILRK